RLLQALSQTSRFVRGPFVLLVDLPRGDQDRELKISSTNGAFLAGWNTEVALSRAVDRDVGGAWPRSEVGPCGQKTPPFIVQIFRGDRWQPRERHRVDVWRQGVLGP